MTLEINDFLPLYPDQNDPDLQSKIYNQYESRKFKYDKDEIPPKERGEYYLNQYEFEFILLMLDRVLIISGYGTGKTCTVVKAVERFKNMYLNGESQYRRCFFVTKGKLLEDQSKEQIMCRCTKKGEYDTYKVRSADKHKKKILRINKSIGKYWSFRHYKELANNIEAHYENDKAYLIEKYDYSIFFFDEVQILNNPFKNTEDSDEDEEKEDINYKSIYYSIIKLMDLLQHKKIIVASATPATNSVSNYIPIINLINPIDNRIDLNTNIKNWKFKDIYPYIMNKIVYIKEELLEVEIKEHGNIIKYNNYKTQIRGVHLEMSKFQSAVFESQPSGNFDIKKIEASNMSYPNKKVGGDGFESYFRIENKHSKFINQDSHKYFELDRIGKYSVKDKFIIDMCLNNPERKIMIYDELVVGSGLLDLAKELELAGYERFMPGTNIYTDNIVQNEVCAYGREIQPEVLDEYKIRKKRYVIITQFSYDDISTVDAFNSVYNVTGAIAHVIILSKKAKDGLNLYDTDLMIRRSGPRNMTTYNQSLYRILRTGGFTQLINHRGKDKITVDVYNLVAVSRTGNSIDAKLYASSEQKEKEIRKFFRYFKRAAVNCHSQLERNIKGKDYTLGCDYRKCKYECFLPQTNDPIRYNEYNLLFSKNDIDECKRLIINIFRIYNSMKLDNLLNLFSTKKFTDYVVIMSLFEIIFNKIPIRNFFGYSNFLYEKDDILYVSGEFPYNNVDKNPLDSYYTQNIIAFSNSTFTEFIAKNTITKIDKKIKDLMSIKDGNEIKNKIYSMTLDERAYLTEYAVMNPTIEIYNKIIKTAKYFLFELEVPVKEIKKAIIDYPEESKKDNTVMRKTRGRKRKIPIKKKVDREIKGGLVKVHSYNIVDRGGRSYTSNFFGTHTSKIRIFQDEKWRDADPHEKMVYEKIINEKINVMLEEYNKFKFYGIVFTDGIFRVVDTKKLLESGNKRDKAVGRNCINIEGGKNKFLYIMYKLEIPIPGTKTSTKDKKKFLKKHFKNKKMYAFEQEHDIDQWSNKKIKYYYYWITYYNKNTVDEICTKLKNYFQEEDMLLII